jgi:flagellin-like hook-associated protein FlgL
MTNILTNSAALKSLFHLQKNDGAATEATERLASGKRINKAGDDAAGAAIVNRMTSQISGMEVAIRNAGDAYQWLKRQRERSAKFQKYCKECANSVFKPRTELIQEPIEFL